MNSTSSGKQLLPHVFSVLYAVWKTVWVADSMLPFSVHVSSPALTVRGFALLLSYGAAAVRLYCMITAAFILTSTVLPAKLRRKLTDFTSSHKALLLPVFTCFLLLSPLLLLLLRGNTGTFLTLASYDGNGFFAWLHQGFSDINLPKRQLISFILFYFLPLIAIDFMLFTKPDRFLKRISALTLPRALPFSGTVSLSFITALLIRMQAESSCSNHPFDETMYGQFPFYTILNILIILAWILLLCAVSKNPPMAMVITGALTTVLSLVNYYTLQWHGTFFRVEEILNIRSAWNVLQGYQFSFSGESVHIIFCFFAVCLTAYIAKKALPPLNRKAGLISAAVSLLTLCIIAFCFVLHNNASIGLWNLHELYSRNGMILSTLQTTYANALPQVSQPDNYNPSLLSDDVCWQYAQPAKIHPEEYPDVILILNEAWYDMDYLQETKADVDYLKTWHSLKDHAITGHVLVPGTGGLTNASEYELLTSNSLHLLRSDTPNNVLSFNNSLSIVSYLELLGYSSLAAHPGNPASYRRGLVWEQLGFDDCFFQDDFHNLGFYGNRTSFATDISLFREFTSLYENMPADKPRLCFLLTIQNHGEWNHNPSSLNYVKSGERFSYAPTVSEQIDEFLTCTAQTDDMIKEMISYFQNSARPVVLCMAGDHAPSFIHDINSTTRSGEDAVLAKRATPFFIWSNRDLFPVSIGNGPEEMIDLCSLTPLALQSAGLPLSPYYGILAQLSAEMPLFTRVAHPNDVPALDFYFNMEYNSIGEKKGSRLDRLFTP